MRRSLVSIAIILTLLIIGFGCTNGDDAQLPETSLRSKIEEKQNVLEALLSSRDRLDTLLTLLAYDLKIALRDQARAEIGQQASVPGSVEHQRYSRMVKEALMSRRYAEAHLNQATLLSKKLQTEIETTESDLVTLRGEPRSPTTK